MTQPTRAIVVFDIDGVVRDVGGSYRRALADTVEHFTAQAYRPTSLDIDQLKSEGIWNNDWEASQEFIYRYFQTQGQTREQLQLDYKTIVAFFQSRYRGTDPENWTGYICNEPLLLQPSYLDQLTQAGISWGFFSGATRASATYVLEKRLGLQSPLLIAMEDAPGKPDPTGLFTTIRQLENGLDNRRTILYVGDTVADMYTVEKARALDDSRTWIGIGILPPHVQETAARRDAYESSLIAAGAAVVFSNVQELTPRQIQALES
ncbi:TIGR01548 family HAD-type hydrolase [Cylindrospermum sp. FACHB-282]|uniref:TIGR01548 family HAD-type hydrolase n=1 Tax=Cylindrospermum sp. FACHB-282 TaxID=2692794 RepID=UPI0016856DA1|nr:TIGR01548 family HAD-type hydrolase [Cylindrospermum sp. FACHB-282]MBD2387859.1 TIGR01548 family HAD-type hydrolase [Cylindrospermum sp. FACHB-282]